MKKYILLALLMISSVSLIGNQTEKPRSVDDWTRYYMSRILARQRIAEQQDREDNQRFFNSFTGSLAYFVNDDCHPSSFTEALKAND